MFLGTKLLGPTAFHFWPKRVSPSNSVNPLLQGGSPYAKTDCWSFDDLRSTNRPVEKTPSFRKWSSVKPKEVHEQPFVTKDLVVTHQGVDVGASLKDCVYWSEKKIAGSVRTAESAQAGPPNS